MNLFTHFTIHKNWRSIDFEKGGVDLPKKHFTCKHFANDAIFKQNYALQTFFYHILLSTKICPHEIIRPHTAGTPGV